MPRTLSNRAIQSALALETSDAFLVLLTFIDPIDGTEYRAVLNTEDVESRGEIYTACYFSFALPPDDDEAPKGVSVSIDNVDLGLVSLLRSVTVPIQCVLEIVVSATPDVVELALTDLVLREVTWDEQTITGNLVSDDPLNQAYPADVYEPRTYEGIF